MPDALPGLAPPASLRLPGPVWGFDLSTVRVSLGMIGPGAPEWNTLSLPKGSNLWTRQAEAVRELQHWLRIYAFAPPVLAGFEAPLAGGHTPLPSFYLVGAFLAAWGAVFPMVELVAFSPGEWKLKATGLGYGRFPKETPKAAKRKLEKQRLVDWARECCGYVGGLDDEADALGVATATGVVLEMRAARPAA